jgi:hypothetical protein
MVSTDIMFVKFHEYPSTGAEVIIEGYADTL